MSLTYTFWFYEKGDEFTLGEAEGCEQHTLHFKNLFPDTYHLASYHGLHDSILAAWNSWSSCFARFGRRALKKLNLPEVATEKDLLRILSYAHAYNHRGERVSALDILLSTAKFQNGRPRYE